ncbi:MAG: urea amidolyase family protein [Verrucomicrobiota bacterium]
MNDANEGREGQGPSCVPWGPCAWMVRWDRDADGAVGWMERRLAEDPPEGLEEWVAGFSSVLVKFRGRAPAEDGLRAWMGSMPGSWPALATGKVVEVPVRYDGPDLEEVARRTGLGVDEVVRRHMGGDYRVRCLGFSPGFAYLSGLDPALHVPRRDTPRERVRVGSVAIGGEHAGVYTVPSPGGWHVLGTTRRRLFDPGAARLADRFVLATGDRLRFVASQDAGEEGFDGTRWVAPSSPWLRVRSMGAALGVQDDGRPGWSRFGVPVGGSLDRVAAHWANRLLGNEDGAPVLEMAGGGQVFEVLLHLTVSVTGADAQGFVQSPDGSSRSLRAWATTSLGPGDVVTFRGPRQGTWTYLGLAGGVAAPVVMGSASVNRRAGLGAAPCSGETLSGRSGDALVGGGTASRWVNPARLPARGPGSVRVWPGPQSGWLDAEGLRALFRQPWRVGLRSDRVGYRMEGEPVRMAPRRLESEPVMPGTIQLPPDGQPIVTMPDGPTVGGYPKVGWVDPRDMTRLVQAGLGRMVEWVPVGWD